MKQKLIKEIERDILINIVISVRHFRIDLSKAQEISKKFLSKYPFASLEEVFETLFSLGKEYKEMKKVYLKHIEKYETEKSQERLMSGRIYMKQNEFEKAVSAMKGVSYGTN